MGWENATSPVTESGATADRSTELYSSRVFSFVSCAVTWSPVTSWLMSRRVGSKDPHDVTSETSDSRDHVAPSSLDIHPRSVYPSGKAANSASAPVVRLAGNAVVMSATNTDPASALRINSICLEARSS